MRIDVLVNAALGAVCTGAALKSDQVSVLRFLQLIESASLASLSFAGRIKKRFIKIAQTIFLSVFPK
jgi:hypothetical protein